MSDPHYDFSCGIDPGLSGGFACESWGALMAPTQLYKMGSGPTEILRLVDEWGVGSDSRAIAFIEEVGGFTGHPQPGSRMFKFGQNFGQLEMLFVSAGYKLVRVRPQTWQKRFSLLSRKGETRDSHKRRICSRARELNPGITNSITLANCDALMILRWGQETIPWV